MAYVRDLAGRAVADTAGWLGWGNPTRIVVNLAISGVVLWVYRGREGVEAAGAQANWFVSWLLVAVAGAIAIFLLHLLAISPYRMLRDKDGAIAALGQGMAEWHESLKPRVEVVVDETCGGCLPGARERMRMGVWNKSAVTIQNAHVYVSSAMPGERRGKLELRWTGEKLGTGHELSQSMRPEDHHHVDLLRTDNRGFWTLDVADDLWLGGQKTFHLLIEARDMDPYRAELVFEHAGRHVITVRPIASNDAQHRLG